MPQLGESVAEGTIGKWLKQPGDHVDKYEPLLDVITDKVNAEVPSPFEGVLREILAEEGATVPNDAEIAIIETAEDGSTTAPATAASAATNGSGSAPASGPAGSDESSRRAEEAVARVAAPAPAPAAPAPAPPAETRAAAPTTPAAEAAPAASAPATRTGSAALAAAPVNADPDARMT